MIDHEELCKRWDWRIKQIKEHTAAGEYSKAQTEADIIKAEIQELKTQVFA